MTKKYDVLVAGDYFLDLVFTGLPAYMQLGEEIFAGGFEMLPGGAFNSVAAMHRLELRVGWAADFGNDDFSRFAVERARAEGLDDCLFVYHSRPLRHITVAASYPEDRAFLTYTDPPPPAPAILKALPQASARAFYLPGLYYGPLMEAGLQLLRAKGMRLVMDVNTGKEAVLTNPAVRKAVSRADLLLPNAREARCLAGEASLEKAVKILGEVCRLVVVKDGPNGAYACQDGQVIHSPAIPVEVVDTTGAGDCFNAGFMRAWLDGRALEECLRWGNVCGGLSTTGHGGTGRVVRLSDVQKWL
jgi:sugar/nucleoside kinase (ribokinase family)